MAHITGGGMVDNLPRILPSSCKAMIEEGSWEAPPVFAFLQEAGKVPAQEMRRTFNNGIGMILVAPESAVQGILEFLAAMDEKAYVIGNIVRRKKKGEHQVAWR
jgi:phosphoribosylformylglycinamidine cyclo-ligase